MDEIASGQEGRGAAHPRVVHRALLVGIRTYPAIPESFGQPLAGCHNDVVNLRQALLGRGFDQHRIEILTDRLADCPCPLCGEPADDASTLPTREGILAAMERLLEVTEPGDVVVFYYSGHGSEFSARGRRTGRRFQTFVPHDSGRGGAENRDIGDREIRVWMRRMATRTPYLTLIFDCCHSGGLSDLRGAETAVRRVAPDERQESAVHAPALVRALVEDDGGGPSPNQRGKGRPSAVVLSASAAKELSAETEVEGLRQGLFTHHLTRVLDRPAVDGETWADLFPEIARGVTAANLAQHPRRGGNGPIFEPGPIDPDDIDPPDVIELAKLAVVIGIDYQRGDGQDVTHSGFAPLATPCRDAEEVARVLAEEQGYEIVGTSEKSPGPLLGERATRRRIHQVLHRLVTVKTKIRRETAVVVYFAGHGLVRTDEQGEQKGYLIPSDADPGDSSSWLAMQDLRDQLVDGIADPERLERLGQRGPLERVTSRHLLLILDCCFGGALAYDFYRGGGEAGRPIYYSEYKRFVEGTAWQLLSSASFDQQALDRDPRDPEQQFSPFAQALIEGLSSDVAEGPGGEGGRGDHLVTASELHRHIDRRLKGMGVDIQTPGLSDLRPGDGQFIFTVPGFAPSPLPDPSLHPAANPWRGDEPYGPADDEDGGVELGGDGGPFDDLFFGRERAILELLAHFLACRHPWTSGPDTVAGGPGSRARALAVVGPSGSGITSLLRAGLLPLLAEPVVGRRRLRSWLRREGERYLLLSRDDLRSVRGWIEELGLTPYLAENVGCEDDPAAARAAETVTERVRVWGRGIGWLPASGRKTEPGEGGLVRQSLGVPSFEEQTLGKDQRGWLRRLEIASLLDRPRRLYDHLVTWWKRQGLADFLTVPDRALAHLVGRWRIASTLDDHGSEESAETGWLWLADPLAKASAHLAPADWDDLLARPNLQVVAAVRSDTLTRDPAIVSLLARTTDHGPCWRLHHPTAPTREELWWVAQGPAAARVLFFDPPALADALVDEAATSAAPLALLSGVLHRSVVRAWQRRGSDDRQLVAADLEPAAEAGEIPSQPIARWLAHRAETLYRRLVGEDPARRRTLRAVLLRAITLDQGRITPRPLTWRELDLADPEERRRFDAVVLPALIEARLVVAGEHHLELSCPGLLETWPRLRRWLRVLARRGARWQALWQQALSWEASDFSRDKLWPQDREMRRLSGAAGLNHLERAFVSTSELVGRAMVAEALAARIARMTESDWSRATELAVELVALARGTMARIATLLEELETNGYQAIHPEENGTAAQAPEWLFSSSFESTRRAAHDVWQRSRQLAEQTLREVLAATPLSLPLKRPPEAEGPLEALVFADRQTLRARIGGRVVEWAVTAPDTHGVVVEDGHLPLVGEGEVRPRRAFLVGPEIPFPAVPPIRLPIPPRGPNAQTGHDRSIRYFAPGQLRIPPPLRPAPTRLLGHGGVPNFLAFAPRTSASGPPWARGREGESEGPRSIPRWLASGANLDGGGAEVRLWPIDVEGSLVREPRSKVGPHLLDGLAELLREDVASLAGDPVAAWQRARLRKLDGSAATLEADGVVWQVTAVAEDGSSLELRSPTGGEVVVLELPSAAQGESLATKGLREIQLGPGGGLVAVVSRTGWAGVWSLPEPVLRWGSTGGISTLAWGPRTGDHGGMRRLAVGHLDGTVRLWWCPSDTGSTIPVPEPDGLPIELRPEWDRRHEGFAVQGLVFDPAGRRLLVERRAVYEPFDRRLDAYHLDLDELIELARRHAGRGLGDHAHPRRPAPGSLDPSHSPRAGGQEIPGAKTIDKPSPAPPRSGGTPEEP